MIGLFIDTTSNLINVTLNNNGKFTSVNQVSIMNHSNYVINIIEKLLKDNDLEIKLVNKLIVCNGPGSFTGIRIGVMIAKTIAYCLDIDITTISSLEILGINSNCISLIHDNNNNYYYGIYKNGRILEENLDTLDNILNIIKEYEIDNIYSNKEIIGLESKVRDIDYKVIFEYCKNKKKINPHLVNPYYLKLTSAEANIKND